jgi:16S rRNA (guanine527-N7)-methyltransferase
MEIGSQAWCTLIQEGAAAMGITVSSAQAAMFARHAGALLAWNRTTNLTAITDPEAVAVKHFLDALAPLRHIPAGSAVLDIGSGGGFPGLPLKVMAPSLSITLIDSVRKKVSFLKYAIRTLGLTGVEAHHIRAEALARQPERAGGFDVIVCRALTALADAIRLGRPLLKPGGLMIAMKGEISEAEIRTAAPGEDGGAVETHAIETIAYTLPVLSLPRRLYLVRMPDPAAQRAPR